MFEKFFGSTEEEQLEFLNRKAMITIALVVVGLLMAVAAPDALGVVTLGFLVVWGMPVIKGLFGVTSLAALFSGNIVVGILLFVVYITIAYFAGVIVGVIGLGRWIYLKVKHTERG